MVGEGRYEIEIAAHRFAVAERRISMSADAARPGHLAADPKYSMEVSDLVKHCTAFRTITRISSAYINFKVQ